MRKTALALVVAIAPIFAQPSFEVASVKPAARLAGPDANNRIALQPDGLIARNATLKRLVADAYRVQMSQVQGPAWIGRDEFDIEAKAPARTTPDQVMLMLRALLVERFGLSLHHESRELRVYELVTAKSGIKIQTANENEPRAPPQGLVFRGDMHHLADIIAIQLTIPLSQDPRQPTRASGSPVTVLDKTGLSGIYDFAIDLKPEAGGDMFVSWQRFLRDRLGLDLVSRKSPVDILVIDGARRTPTAN